MAIPYKVGFIGAGNMTQAITKALIETQTVTANHIMASNRSPGKLQRLVDSFGIQSAPTNEHVIDASDIVILAVKPQDFATAVDPLVSLFNQGQIVVSLAAGITLHSLKKKLPQCRVVRVIPNTPAMIRHGVIGYLLDGKDSGLQSVIEDLFQPLGRVFETTDEDQLEALMISCSSGTGFVFELMSYFHDWIIERGFDTSEARQMVIETFLGAAKLASQSPDLRLEELQARVASKKGVTAAGLDSMRELEIERALRYSFEKAALRNRDLAKQSE